MQKDHTTLPDGLARVPRRSFIASLAASVVAAPVVVADRHPEASELLAIDKLGKLSQEVAETLDDWNGGKWSAHIYPSRHHGGISFMPIPRPKTLDQQLDDCVSQLKRILAQMYPDSGEIKRSLVKPHVAGGAVMLLVGSHMRGMAE